MQSRRAGALLVAYMRPACALLAPSRAGASTSPVDIPISVRVLSDPSGLFALIDAQGPSSGLGPPPRRAPSDRYSRYFGRRAWALALRLENVDELCQYRKLLLCSIQNRPAFLERWRRPAFVFDVDAPIRAHIRHRCVHWLDVESHVVKGSRCLAVFTAPETGAARDREYIWRATDRSEDRCYICRADLPTQTQSMRRPSR